MAAPRWTRLLLCLAALLLSLPPALFSCASDSAAAAPDEAVTEENVQGFTDIVSEPELAVSPGPAAESVLAHPSVPSSVPEIQEGQLTATLLPSSPPSLEDGILNQLEEQQNLSAGLEEEPQRGCEEGLLQEKVHAVAEAMFKFTADLVREVELEKGPGNLFISPLSITLALAHLALGAANQTEKALLETLHLAEVPCLHQTLRRVRQQLDQSMLSIAARLYLAKGFQVKETFLEDSERFYKAKPVTLSGNGEEDLAAINGWVKEATKGHIPKFLSELPPDIVMILLNAVHFQGFWKTKFDPELTEPGAFQVDDEFVVSAEMMRAPKYSLSWDFVNSLDVQVAKFPFKGNMSLVAIVPNHFERNISRLLSEVRPASFLHHFPKERPTMVMMPKVHLECHLDLNQAVSQLGLGELFSSPDFRRIADEPLFVSSIQHSSALDLTEAGVEASAATSVGMYRSFSGFFITRPFLFFILEDTTGIPLFFGRVVNPNPGAPKQRKEQADRPRRIHLARNTIPK